MMSRNSIITLAIVILAIIAAGAYYFSMPHGSNAPAGGQTVLPTQTITIGNTPVVAEIASTDAERKAGLSNRPSLASGNGMLFVFGKGGNWGIWMPDMKFSIDIIWTDAAGKVLAVDSTISPATYPAVFYPNSYARFVLEVPAGFAAANHIMVGGHMSLPK